MVSLFKKHKILVISAFFVLVLVLICLIGVMSFGKYKAALNERDQQINNLQSTITNIGDLQTGYVVTKDVRSGDQITDDAITAVDVPTKLGLNVVTDKQALVNNYFKISLNQGTVITKEDILTQKLDATDRYFDVYIANMPIGLKAGDYVDIRVSFPYGQDFIAISHKRVNEINSGILKLTLNESEIYTYRSMLVDTAIYDAQIYAVEYVDGGAQVGSEVFYPINTDLQELYQINPNITNLAEAKIALERSTLESENGGSVSTMDAKKLQEINKAIDDTKSSIAKSMQSAQAALDKRLAEEAQQSASANNGSDSSSKHTITVK